MLYYKQLSSWLQQKNNLFQLNEFHCAVQEDINIFLPHLFKPFLSYFPPGEIAVFTPNTTCALL